MNSSLTSSKRFVLNRTDYDEMVNERSGTGISNPIQIE